MYCITNQLKCSLLQLKNFMYSVLHLRTAYLSQIIKSLGYITVSCLV